MYLLNVCAIINAEWLECERNYYYWMLFFSNHNIVYFSDLNKIKEKFLLRMSMCVTSHYQTAVNYGANWKNVTRFGFFLFPFFLLFIILIKFHFLSIAIDYGLMSIHNKMPLKFSCKRRERCIFFSSNKYSCALNGFTCLQFSFYIFHVYPLILDRSSQYIFKWWINSFFIDRKQLKFPTWLKCLKGISCEILFEPTRLSICFCTTTIVVKISSVWLITKNSDEMICKQAYACRTKRLILSFHTISCHRLCMLPSGIEINEF